MKKPEIPEAPAKALDKEDDLPTAEQLSETPTLRAIHRWVGENIHDSPVSRNTEAYNHLMRQLPKLASLIDEGKDA